jgi:HAE1 family hydrophobic/amphiphilic exporter-1
MGMTVFSGMLVATLVGVVLVPGLYVFVERYIGKPSSTDEKPATEAG